MKKGFNRFALFQARQLLRAPLLRAGFCLLCFAAGFGCGNTASPVALNSNVPSANTERSQTAIAHTSENQTPSTGGSKWTQSGDPIDTTELDAAIAKAEKALSLKPADGAAKLTLGTAYFKRAEALTGARQYASALGDYRRTLKYDPTNAGAKDWMEQIVRIYKSINRSHPNEGEEPPPLPFKKGENGEK